MIFSTSAIQVHLERFEVAPEDKRIWNIFSCLFSFINPPKCPLLAVNGVLWRSSSTIFLFYFFIFYDESGTQENQYSDGVTSFQFVEKKEKNILS